MLNFLKILVLGLSSGAPVLWCYYNFPEADIDRHIWGCREIRVIAGDFMVVTSPTLSSFMSYETFPTCLYLQVPIRSILEKEKPEWCSIYDGTLR
ncbi:hypothetical protein EV426DRAFT_619232 [Tirmania nivea]|nr:hypothetical protein EV426DRAFT_619232 [Tirmania nivea]